MITSEVTPFSGNDSGMFTKVSKEMLHPTILPDGKLNLWMLWNGQTTQQMAPLYFPQHFFISSLLFLFFVYFTTKDDSMGVTVHINNP